MLFCRVRLERVVREEQWDPLALLYVLYLIILISYYFLHCAAF